MNNQEALRKLQTSKFRTSFHLKSKDLDYINQKGMEAIKKHAYDFINQRLKPANIPNDGKQTPMRNHPVFIAQHATATCCRGCLEKWHKIPKNHELTPEEIDYIVDIIISWIENQTKKNNTR